VPDLAVADARRLVEAAPGLHHHPADALVLEQHPALEDVHELHLAVVRVPFAVRRLAGTRADHVRDYLAAGGALDAEVAILEVAAQPAAREFRSLPVRDAEAHGATILR